MSALAVFCVVMSALPAASKGSDETGDCTSTSVLYELDHRDRKQLETILQDAGRVENSQSVLWRVDKPGVAASYLFGTVHIIDPSLQNLTPAVKQAIDGAKVVALESAETTRAARSYAMTAATPLMISLDKELQSALADDDMRVVEKALSDAGYPEQMALALKPWVVTMFLADSKCQRQLQARGLKSIDDQVVERGKANGARIVGLETMLEQYQSLAAISPTLQIGWLKSSLALYPRVDDMAQTISELYRFRKLEAVWPLTQALAPTSGLDDQSLKGLRTELVSKRNVRLADRASRLFDDGNAFVAIGALHQSGADGIVSLLRQRGYTVTAIE